MEMDKNGNQYLMENGAGKHHKMIGRKNDRMMYFLSYDDDNRDCIHDGEDTQIHDTATSVERVRGSLLHSLDCVWRMSNTSCKLSMTGSESILYITTEPLTSGTECLQTRLPLAYQCVDNK